MLTKQRTKGQKACEKVGQLAVALRRAYDALNDLRDLGEGKNGPVFTAVSRFGEKWDGVDWDELRYELNAWDYTLYQMLCSLESEFSLDTDKALKDAGLPTILD